MIRAIVRGGNLCPIDPLPSEWSEGKEIELEARVLPDADADFEEHWARIEAACAQIPDDPEDFRRMEEALAAHRQAAKEYVRKRMGLS